MKPERIEELLSAKAPDEPEYGGRLLLDRVATDTVRAGPPRPAVTAMAGLRRTALLVVAIGLVIALAAYPGLRQDLNGRAVNVGSGRSASVLEIAHELARGLGKEVEPELPGTFRAGDIRHCFADVSLARELLGFEAAMAFDDGLAELAAWLETQTTPDRFDQAAAELAERGLTS